MNKKKNVDLVCDVAELISVFDKEKGEQDILQRVVSTVAWHMRAAVCSIYIYDEESETLTLRATQGLNPKAVGRVQLALGEGIVGRSVQDLRPICVGRASENEWNRFFPGIEEEKYEALLVVPILRRMRRIGALVVQDGVSNYFDKNDTKALRAIAAQLATLIENVYILKQAHRVEKERKVAPIEKKTSDWMITGRSASPGVARGTVLLMGGEQHESCFLPTPDMPAISTQDFLRVVKETEKQINQLQRQTSEDLADVAVLIFNAHLLILNDEEFSGRIAQLIDSGVHAVKAVSGVVNEYVEIFSKSKMPLIREKVLDVKDLGNRLIRNLLNKENDTTDYQGQIIIAHELLPSDILKLSAENVAGFIVTSGITSHNAIICRSLQIPMVALSRQQAESIAVGETILMDATQGIIYLHPSTVIYEKYEQLESTWVAMHKADEMESESFTACGERIHIMSNINLLSDLEPAKTFKAEGVGLYRSEFPFIIRNDFPSEEEQFNIYRKLVEQMEGKPVTFRTLDVGGDKMLSYYENMPEANPFLGLRAIRFSLQNKEVFSQQLRAFLRAGAGGNVRIMFPLIASVDDFLEAQAVVHLCMDELDAEGIPFSRETQLGVMIELPAAVEVIDELAQLVDFFSIGSNDLVQYMLAVDRTNEQVSNLYLAHHPAVLRSLNRISTAARLHGKDLSICGDLSSDPLLLRFLLGIGLRTFSIDILNAPIVQKTIQQTRISDAEAMARELLRFGRISDVEAFFKALPF